MNTVALIQARMSSTRFPGKIMFETCGKTVLEHMVERVQYAKTLDTVAIITSTQPEDDPIQALCERRGFLCYRGSLNDLLDRHYQAALSLYADIVLKIPSDCPLIDPEIIDAVVELFNHSKADYVSNLHPMSYPDGMDVEVMKLSALRSAWEKADKDIEREHTTPYLWDRGLFKVANFDMPGGLDYSETIRLTIDYPDDYRLIDEIFKHLLPVKINFGINEILSLLSRKPQLLEINAHHVGDTWYERERDKLSTKHGD